MGGGGEGAGPGGFVVVVIGAPRFSADLRGLPGGGLHHEVKQALLALQKLVRQQSGALVTMLSS